MLRFWKFSKKMRKNTSSNNVDVKKLNVEDNNEASKTVSFAPIVSEIDFELNDLTVQDTYLCQLQVALPCKTKILQST